MWIEESNRPKHLVGGFLTALVGTILFTTGLAVGMEYKDKLYGNKFDWLDLLATEIGGLLGQAAQVGIVMLII